ncbi:hypothetical protein LPJ57_011580 [Coemansia sp. RSA 486]|nr:hypothetical protein LPJ57_011580 [Coemansia sp. RSA 486]
MVLAPLVAADDELADISMDLGADERAGDDVIYDDSRQVEGDFNYPVIEIGVAFGFSRRRPYGHTISRGSAGSASSSTPSSRPRLEQDYFTSVSNSHV